jgi:sugar lactone lactonase YvrE
MNFLLLAMLAFQLPPSETLSPSDADVKEFNAELKNLKKMLDVPGDHATVTYALARTYAAGGQWPEAIEWLNKSLALDAGIDPSPDKVFQKLRGTAEFSEVREKARAATPPVVRSRIAFSVEEDDLAAEGIAYDARRQRFYIGSTAKHKIVECTAAGECRTFAEGLGEVLGIKIAPDGSVWAASNTEEDSGLFHFAAPSGKLQRKYTLGKGHVFNDLAITAQGDVFATDTRAGTVYFLSHAANRLELLRADLREVNANGIALSDDGRKLYVSAFPDGITVIDVATRASRPIGHPENLCLGAIDGLSFYKGSLIAIQNGVVADRIARFDLTPDGNSIAGSQVLERRHPQWDGITTGAIAAGWYYYMANVDAKAHPTTVLKLPLDR